MELAELACSIGDEPAQSIIREDTCRSARAQTFTSTVAHELDTWRDKLQVASVEWPTINFYSNRF